MRVLYVYRDYAGRRAWYGKEIWKQGHKVLYHKATKTQKGALTRHHIKKEKPHLLWLLNPFYIESNPEAIAFAKKKKIPIVMYGTLDPQCPYHDWLHLWKQIDFLFVHHKGLYNYLKKQGLNAYYMPIGFYPKQYFPIEKSKSYDLSFCGGSRSSIDPDKDKRTRYIRSLESRNIVVYGDVFKGRVGNIPVYHYA